jgi:hypothetical protein
MLTESQRRLLEQLKRVANEQLKDPGLSDEEKNQVGPTFTPLIGELSACKIVRKLRWRPSVGYDAVDGGRRVQIKSRRPQSEDSRFRSGNVGRFRNEKFKDGMLVELDSRFEVSRIFEMSRGKIMKLQAKRKSKKRGIRLRDFRNAANQIYP